MRNLITKTVYHTFDLLNGNMIGNHYSRLKNIYKTSEPFNIVALNKYIANYQEDRDIHTCPLIDKSFIKSKVSDINLQDVYSWAYTGGSYGEPTKIPYSKERACVRTATFRFYNELAGYGLGDSYMLARAKTKSALLKYLRNEFIFIPNDISDNKLSSLIDELRHRKVNVLMGYSSVIYALALYLRRFPDKFKGLQIKSIVTSSEPIEDFKREIIQNTFNCMFCDRYSNEEVGMIAQQNSYNSPYFVNKYGVYVEVLDPVTLLPVREGEIGKVVVTDIFNDLLPMIRYDTGDLAKVHEYNDNQLYSIKNVIGRTAEIINAPSGHPISSLMLGPYIYKPLADAGDVYQYQFAQIGKHNYCLRIKAPQNKLTENVKKAIYDGLVSVLGVDAKVVIKLVNNIEPLPSGKRPIFVNEVS